MAFKNAQIAKTNNAGQTSAMAQTTIQNKNCRSVLFNIKSRSFVRNEQVIIEKMF